MKNTILDTVGPAMVALDLLTDDDLDRAHALAREASQYTALARNSDQHVSRKIAEAGDKLLNDPKASVDKVVAATTNIPDARAVTAIAEQLERKLNRQANAIVLERSGEIVGPLNTRLVEIADDTARLADELGHVTTPQQAIDAGLVDEWREAHALVDEYKALATLVRELRELKIVPRPTGAQSGAWWMFLADADHSSWLPENATPWQRHVRDMNRRPWVPASVDEAEAVRAEWERAA